jgi:Ca2+-binding RTX toxin-like protein
MTTYAFTTSFTTTGILTGSPAPAASYNTVFVAEDVAVASSDNDAISVTGSRNTAVIAGTVLAADSAVVLGSNAAGDYQQVLRVRASGQLMGSDASGAVELNGRNGFIDNAGYIYSTNVAIKIHDVASVSGDQTVLVNTGLIQSGATAIMRDDADTTETFVIKNAGTIYGGSDGLDSFAFYSGDGVIASDHITNTGKMIGIIETGGGDDFVDTNKGVLEGNNDGTVGTINLGDGNDTAYGSAAADAISGGAGSDIVRGGGGNDTLVGGFGGLNPQDYIDYSDKTTKVEITLLAVNAIGTMKVNGVVEDTFANFGAVIGGSAGDVLTGNAISNNLAGHDGNDTLNGASGNDSIFGGNGSDLIFGALGNDQLTGNAGADFFRFNYTLSTSNNVDTITDFTHASDKIQLEDAIFSALTSPWSSTQFKSSASGHVANTASQHILYDQSTGVLWYDPDGNGAGTQTAFAKLGTSTHPTIDWTDFAIV